MRVADRRILTVQGSDVARRSISPPGSAVKPLSLLALIEAGKLGAEDQYVCPRQLVIDGHSLPCSHPIVPLPMNVSRAIAYSCNCAVAHFAQRFERGELSTFLIRAGGESDILDPPPYLPSDCLSPQQLARKLHQLRVARSLRQSPYLHRIESDRVNTQPVNSA
jgi:hypothetical protein